MIELCRNHLESTTYSMQFDAAPRYELLLMIGAVSPGMPWEFASVAITGADDEPIVIGSASSFEAVVSIEDPQGHVVCTVSNSDGGVEVSPEGDFGWTVPADKLKGLTPGHYPVKITVSLNGQTTSDVVGAT